MSDSTIVNAWAALEPGAKFEPYQFEFGPLEDDEIEIEVTHCGIRHSDHNMRNDDWGMTEFPFVGGHEIEGRIIRLGTSVTNLQVGDRVGAGWFGHTDRECPCALAGNHNLSPTSQGTVVGRHGGFADRVRVESTWTFPLTDAIPVGEAGPVRCSAGGDGLDTDAEVRISDGPGRGGGHRRTRPPRRPLRPIPGVPRRRLHLE